MSKDIHILQPKDKSLAGTVMIAPIKRNFLIVILFFDSSSANTYKNVRCKNKK